MSYLQQYMDIIKFPKATKTKRIGTWNQALYLKLLDKIPFIKELKEESPPETQYQSALSIPDLEKAAPNPYRKEIFIGKTKKDDNSTLVELQSQQNEGKYCMMTYKLKMFIASLILFVFQGFTATWFGYSFSTQCMSTPVLPWMVFTHGIVSLATFLIIFFIFKNNLNISHTEVRILSSIYAAIVICGIIISIFNDSRVEGNGMKNVGCRNEVAILLKVNTPWAIGQICLLQLLII